MNQQSTEPQTSSIVDNTFQTIELDRILNIDIENGSLLLFTGFLCIYEGFNSSKSLFFARLNN